MDFATFDILDDSPAPPPLRQPSQCQLAAAEKEHTSVARPAELLTCVSLIELLLKDQPLLNRTTRSSAAQQRSIPQLLAIGLAGYTIFSVVLVIVFASARVWPELTAPAEWLSQPGSQLIRFVPENSFSLLRRLGDGTAWPLILAYPLGLVGAIGVCLPSFYFYGLLAGVRTTWLQVVTHAVQCLAAGALAVLGALPIYLAFMLAVTILTKDPSPLAAGCLIGMALPFLAGVYGTWTLHEAFLTLADTMPARIRAARSCFLGRLLFAWSVCYTAITPLMIFTLWEYFAR